MFRSKPITAWAFYDWADSAFATTVMAGFFPLFFKIYCNPDIPAETSTLRLGLTNSLASLTVALAAPFLGALADARAARKLFLALSALLGAAATLLLAYVSEGAWLWAAFLYGLGVIGFSASLVFYDSLLPQLSGEKSPEAVSSLGYAMGYLGGGLLFLLNVLMYSKPAWFGLADKTSAVKASFVCVAVWWVLFSLPLLIAVPEKQSPSSRLSSLAKLRCTLGKLIGNRNLIFFLLAYWLYIDGVNSVVKMAIDYGISLGFGAQGLIIALLITQFVGFPAAIACGLIGERIGARRVVLAGISAYCLITVWASIMQAAWEFYLLAVFVGLVQGGVQALSRSLYSCMIPADESAEYFSFYNVVGRFASVLGPALIGMTAFYSASERVGILSLLLLFGVGAFLLSRVDISAAKL